MEERDPRERIGEGLARVAVAMAVAGALLWGLFVVGALYSDHELSSAALGMAAGVLSSLTGLGSALTGLVAVLHGPGLRPRYRLYALVGLAWPAAVALWIVGAVGGS